MTTTSCAIRMIGAPTDANSSHLRGPAKGPAAIRAHMASGMSNAAAENGGELGSSIRFEDAGDLPLTMSHGDDALIEAGVAAAYADGFTPLILGGDHAITYPVLKAVAARHGPVTILHIDAHPDLYDDFEGNPRSHASPFARIMEKGLARRLVQVGIRTLNAHQRDQAARFLVEIVPMRGFDLGQIPKISGPLYISIDLDGLDPSCAPGVSHHEPGGLTTRQLLDILGAIDAEVVGADVVELNPDRDINGITAAVAAKIVKELAALIAANARG